LDISVDKDGGYNGDDDGEDGDDYNDTGNHHINDDIYNEFFSFIEKIYNNCKKLEILPAGITSWIKDIIDCQDLIIDINEKVF